MMSTVKTFLLLLGGLALAATRAHAAPASTPAAAVDPEPAWTPKTFGWTGLTPALTPAQAAAVLQPKVGAPLIVIRTKGGRFETWNYDHGGDLLFVNGALLYWTVPHDGPNDLDPTTAVGRLANDKSTPVAPARHGA